MLAPGYVPVEREERPLKTTTVKVAGWIGQERLDQLKETLLIQRQMCPRCVRGSPCGLLGVPKPLKEVLRVIFDARPARNERLQPQPEQLILFTSAMLVWGTSPIPCRAHGRLPPLLLPVPDPAATGVVFLHCR
jgi:hypothetical protein